MSDHNVAGDCRLFKEIKRQCRVLHKHLTMIKTMSRVRFLEDFNRNKLELLMDEI